MKEWTGFELHRVRDELETSAATVLGRIIFEFSRLDMNLGLTLVWAHEGSNLEELTSKIVDYSFHKKLDCLRDLSLGKYSGNPRAKRAYADWLELADKIRSQRNDLIHGRWGVEARSALVVNVVGLPTGEQYVRHYTIPELERVLAQLKQLQRQLSDLGSSYPI